MDCVSGDLWNYWGRGYSVVVPVNIGWTRAGYNVMGAGVAKQAAARWPSLPGALGAYQHAAYLAGVEASVWPYCPGDLGALPSMPPLLWMFPTKPLNVAYPWLSWKAEASLTLIAQSAEHLALFVLPGERVALPLVGCGNGGLHRDQVLPILAWRLDGRFTLVERE